MPTISGVLLFVMVKTQRRFIFCFESFSHDLWSMPLRSNGVMKVLFDRNMITSRKTCEYVGNLL